VCLGYYIIIIIIIIIITLLFDFRSKDSTVHEKIQYPTVKQH